MANKATRLVVSFRSAVTARWVSTKTTTERVAKKNWTKEKKNNLYSKLLTVDGSKDETIGDALDKWVEGGRTLKRGDIVGTVALLSKSKKFSEAVQVFEWMEKRKNTMTEVDHAIHVNLLGKVKGVAYAEEYFNSLQGSLKTKKTYGALLGCYRREKELEKALDLFEKIKALGFSTTLSYNDLMGLYLLVGQPEKVPPLAEEMEVQNVAADMYTYNILINSCASLKDFDAVEGVLEKMNLKEVKFDWFTCVNLATIYANAGNLDRANAALYEIEKMKYLRDLKALHALINLYTRTSNLSGVNRAWEHLKLVFPKPINTSYLVMLLAVSKLGDVDTLEKCFREWESDYSNYDVRLPNVVLESYLKRDMIEEANLIYENMLKKGAEPNLRTLEVLANYHIGKRQIDLALKYVDMVPSKANREKLKWFPTDETVRMFLMYFEEDYDAERAQKFSNIMKRIGRLDSTVHESLLRTNIAAGVVES